MAQAFVPLAPSSGHRSAAMVLAAARRFATPLRGALAPRWAAPGSAFGAARTAVASSSPAPLSLRMDSLMVKCCIAAVVYFAPQDVVFLGGLFWVWHSKASAISPKKVQKDADAAVEEFKAKKGLEEVKVSKGRSTW
eukprot:CAMPEP_0197885060 /NCGR_PEP_ID=MMETSP1439-20131203/11299_1 /TAXON_ID=66791 /ORGANISM="Gonyaulax spinifera, Strain CCMP409" /LENGTH=136 /DNA_ID=CAMNT_0043504813 /DNA_START=20 /DNA_END=427 /DNA_ORIENTATION=+